MDKSVENRITTKPRHWNWGWSIASVYSVFALATIGFAAFSFSQKVELVSNDYYAQEINYDAHAMRMRNSNALGSRPLCVYDESARTLLLTFPMQVNGGNVHMYRPSASALDRSYAIKTSATHSMSISTSDLTHGVWRIKIEWESGGIKYYDEIRQEL